MATAGKIQAIESASVHRITSNQVIIDLQTAIKELVENSLDANATSIEVRIKDHGLKSIEVMDNGTGIAKEDYASVGLKHHTSKLTKFEDLTSVDSFGFRGEAIASLCALSENVAITTSTSSETPMGTVLQFDRVGRMVDDSGKVARQRGTTVTVTGLFIPLPVRRKEFERHAKRELAKTLSLLSAYALFPASKAGSGVKFLVSHLSDTGKKSVLIQTDGTSTLRASIISLWGPKALEHSADLHLDLNVDVDTATMRKRGLATTDMLVNVSGIISRFAYGCGRSAPDRQYLFVNGRPCNLTKIQKAFNEVYRTFNSNQYPMIAVNFSLPKNACDINVSPDKRTIFVHSEQNLIEALKTELQERFDPTRSVFAIQGVPDKQQFPPKQSKSNNQSNSDVSLQASDNSSSIVPESSEGISVEDNCQVESLGGAESITVDDEVRSEEADELAIPPEASSPSETSESGELSSSKRRKSKTPSPSLSPEPQPQTATTRSHTAPKHTLRNERENSVQMVLDTRGASWALKPGSKSNGNQHTSSTLKSTSAIASRTGQVAVRHMKVTLSQFKRGGGPIEDQSDVEMEENSEGEIQDVEGEGDSMVDELATQSSPVRVQAGPAEVLDNEQESEKECEPRAETARVPRSRSASSAIIISDDEQPKANVEAPTIDIPGATNNDNVHARSQKLDEIVRTSGVSMTTLPFNFDRITGLYSDLASKHKTSTDTERSHKQQNETVSPIQVINVDEDTESAEQGLSRIVKKEDFGKMEILGQFNLGFIVARLQRAKAQKANTDGEDGGDSQVNTCGDDGIEEDDLFIIDQHAADEKYNFETLQLTTKIQSQKLLSPRVLELSAADKMVAIENIHILQNNGFEVEVRMQKETRSGPHSEGDEELTYSQSEEVMLVAQPVSKGTVFEISDLEELLHLLRENHVGGMVRCSKARAMFASRACRKSVMIGHPLTRSQMTSIVRHMGTMDQPWNCPHGRPTMRHLATIPKPSEASARRDISWKGFLQ